MRLNIQNKLLLAFMAVIISTQSLKVMALELQRTVAQVKLSDKIQSRNIEPQKEESEQQSVLYILTPSVTADTTVIRRQVYYSNKENRKKVPRRKILLGTETRLDWQQRLRQDSTLLEKYDKSVI
jgi:hypothetical protein